MNHFDYRNGVLHAEAVNLAELAAAVGTPFYCYSTATLERHFRVFTDAFAGERALICYAMKANSNQSVLRTLAKLGAGADVVSGGELKRALAAGIPPQKVVFSGVGKTEAELRAALAADILCINIESEPELELLSRLAAETDRTARISVRVNPDIDAEPHPAAVARLREAIGGADGLLICSPEYVRGVAGAMKNALDRLVSSFEFPGKPVAVVNASQRSTHADAAQKLTLVTMSARLVEDASMTLPLLGRNLDADGIVADRELSIELREALEVFAEAIRG